MAEIVAKFDTKTKTFDATMDGKEIGDIARVSFCKNYDGEFMCCIETMAMDEENDINKMSSMYASKEKQNKIIEDVQKYFQNLK